MHIFFIFHSVVRRKGKIPWMGNSLSLSFKKNYSIRNIVLEPFIYKLYSRADLKYILINLLMLLQMYQGEKSNEKVVAKHFVITGGVVPGWLGFMAHQALLII